MRKLDYNQIKEIFNSKIFENSRGDLISKLSKYPERYIGLFRPTKPKTKIIQNITQSHEIKFGDAFEILIRKVFEMFNYKTLELKDVDEQGNVYNYDQLFMLNNELIFIEQKVRDDHDSTKKRGQIENFEKKLNLLLIKYKCKIRCYFYFIDPSLKKNRNYYLSELAMIEESYGVNAKLCYADELFEYENLKDVWEGEVISFLKQWRDELHDMPEVNFDKVSSETMKELSEIKPLVFRKLFDNEELVKTIFPIIFPDKIVLRKLNILFEERISEGGNTLKIYTSLKSQLNKAMILY